MKIPFLDLPLQIQVNKSKYLQIISEVIDQAAFISGKYVEEFESNAASYLDSKYAIGVNSGTSALHLALKALGVAQGDEVILPSHTFIATAWAVTYLGATPVFVDVDPEYYTLDTQKIEEKITSKTKVILPVHLYGQAADLATMLQVCKKYNLSLVEDACQAFGAEYYLNDTKKKLGTIGDIACFSFYPGKNLGAFGEAGLITTNNEDLSNRVKSLRNHAQAERYVHQEVGYNYRMDGFQGAILNYKLQFINNWNTKRSEIAKLYSQEFADFDRIKTPRVNPNSTHIFHLYELKLNSTAERESLINFLTENEIQTGLHYPIPIHLQKPYLHLGYKGKLPVTEDLSNTLLSLPIFPEMTSEQVEFLIQKVKQWVKYK